MIPCQLAIDQGCLDLELFSYSSAHCSMPIHEAFYRGLIVGELRTTSMSAKPLLPAKEKVECDYDRLFSSSTNIINSVSEFRNTIQIDEQCQLTTDGFIKQKSTGECYLLTRAMELGFISISSVRRNFPRVGPNLLRKGPSQIEKNVVSRIFLNRYSSTVMFFPKEGARASPRYATDFY
jgi:hypothetical protein